MTGAAGDSPWSQRQSQGMRPVWVTAAMPESIAWLVKDASQFYLSPFRRDRINITIRKWTLLPGVDAATRTLQLRLEVDNADEALKPGMNAWLNSTPPANRCCSFRHRR